MKRSLLLAITIAALGATYAMAKGNHPMAGCGLAYMLFAKDNDQTLQILASTTNNSMGSQSSGITSGTSGCTTSGLVRLDRERIMFAEANFKNLEREFAAGEGKFAVAMASLLGCRKESHTAFLKLAQEKYGVLFTGTKTTPLDLLNNIEAQIAADPELSKSCTL